MVEAFAIILAAGFSTRMGKCKATLSWYGNHTLLTYQVAQFLEIGVLPIVVLGQHNAQLQEHCQFPCSVAINSDASKGKVSSILTGLKRLPSEWDAVFISAVDQPRSGQIYQSMLDVFKQNRALITVPTWGNRRGHPTLFSQSLLPELFGIQDKTFGLRHIVQVYKGETDDVEINSSSIFCDLNTEEIYTDAMHHFCQKSTTSYPKLLSI